MGVAFEIYRDLSRTIGKLAWRAASILPTGVDLAAGDVTDAESLAAALRDCPVVFHAAGLPEQWQPDAGIFERVNVGGTASVVPVTKPRARRGP